MRLFGLADGLPSAAVNCIVRDSRGFLWFCTEEGLSRFDGYTFANYGSEHGLPDRSTYDLLETSDGEYWVATLRGLLRFEPRGIPGKRAGERRQYFEVYAPAGVERASQISKLALSRDGSIWCSTADGLYSFDRIRHTFRMVLPEIPGAWWGAMLPDPDGSLWLGASRLAHLLPDGHLDWYGPGEGFSKNPLRVSDLARDREGRLWVATWAGLYRFTRTPQPGHNSVDRVYDEKDGLPNHTIFALLQPSKGPLLVGLEQGGIFEFVEGTSKRPDRFRSFAGKNGLEIPEIGQPAIDMMAEDISGNIWTSRAMRISPTGFVGYGTQDGLKTNDVGSVFEDRDGRLIVLTCDPRCRFINAFDGERFSTTEANLPAAMSQVTWGFGQIHFQDHTGAWWMATSKGLCRYAPTRELHNLAKGVPDMILTKKNGLPGEEVFRLFEDSKADVWISVLGANAVTRWRRTMNSLETFWTDQNSRPLDVPTVFAEDHAGDLWIGFFGPGIARYRDGKMQVFTPSDGMPRSSVRALFVDHLGCLWIGTGRAGLIRVDDPGAAAPQFQVWNTASGLSSNEIKAITEDRHGKLYLGTGRGIDRIDPATGYIRHYTSADGLGFSSTPRVAFRDRQGILWFGGPSLLRFDPDQIVNPNGMPPVRVTSVRVRGQQVPIAELGEQNFRLNELASGENDIRIEFAALNFTAGQKIRYQFKLEGVDTDWGVPVEDRAVSYAKLPHGNYHFAVRALTSDGLMNESPVSVFFTITPPLWRRWWFMSLAAALASCAALAAHRYKVRQHVAVERMRMGIATDLHDDVGATLSQISLLTELARRESRTDIDQADSRLSQIGDLAREMIESMAEIVWVLNPQHDRLSDLTAHMRRFASDALAARDISFELTENHSDAERIVSSAVRRQIFLVFKESIHNVVKHAACRRVHAVLTVDRDRVQLSVADDGRGFDTSCNGHGANVRANGNGIASMKNRAVSLGGSLSVDSKEGAGTCLNLSVPLGRRRW